MANSNILAQIANPQMATPGPAFMAGRDAVQRYNLLQQQAAQKQEEIEMQRRRQEPELTLLQRQAEGAGIQNKLGQQKLSQQEVAEQKKGVAQQIFSAFTIGPGEDQDAILSNLISSPKIDDTTKRAVQNLLSLEPGAARDTEFKKAISMFQQTGILPKAGQAGKSPEQLAREAALEERKILVSEKGVELREKELNKGPASTTKPLKLEQLLAKRDALPEDDPDRGLWEAAIEKEVKASGSDIGAKSSLGKLISERDALPPDSKDRVAYDEKIARLTEEKSTSISENMVANLATQVVESRLDPNKISKRGGLQQAVFSFIEENFPDTNLVELEANARFKNTAANLQSRALIGGVQPLYDKLLATGETLHNSSIQLVNKAVNFAKEQTGSPEIVAFNNLRDDVIAETERILLGSGVLSDTKYQRALGNVSSAQSLPQLKAAVTQLEFVVEARLEALDKMPFPEASKVRKKELEKFSGKVGKEPKNKEQPAGKVIKFDAEGNML